MVLPSRRFRRLRRHCASRLAALELPATADLTVLCEHLARRRGRPIRLLPMPLSEARPCGLWLALPDVDLIAYESGTNRLHQEHIVAHELAHLICGHANLSGGPGLDTRALFPDLDPKLVRALLQRSHYSDDQEQEAEVMASMLLSRLSRPPAAPDGPAGVTSRLAQALLPPRRGGRTDA
ncbi:hypothetical protein AB0J80_32880 [Actinoplanes sp. NPDC049548]|uniref:hypothetical protein n=1 Tax=Actinoplanes sp. NPDC049548 TaxID=3155152 RepID=UPI0034406A51